MSECVFVSDLHGDESRCVKLFDFLQAEKPGALFIGGDILPPGFGVTQSNLCDNAEFLVDYFLEELKNLRETLSSRYPQVFIILGNDDPAVFEEDVQLGVKRGLWQYVHNSRRRFHNHSVYGYSFIPPSPFQLKDWEKYDASRYTDPGSVSPEDGILSRKSGDDNRKFQTIDRDIKDLVGDDDLSNSVFLFHAPPYETYLDRAALDGKSIDHAQLDVHVGSIAIKRFIEQKQPLLTLHGHIHESSRLTGSWRDRFGRTHMFTASHDGPELAIVRFDLDDLDAATRLLL